MTSETIYGDWKIVSASTGTGLSAGPAPSQTIITIETDNVVKVQGADWGGVEEFTIADFHDELRPHLIKRSTEPVILIDGDEAHALFGLIRETPTDLEPKDLEVVVELTGIGGQGGGSARGKR